MPFLRRFPAVLYASAVGQGERVLGDAHKVSCIAFIRWLDLTLAGTIKMTLEGGTVCWVSRRYVKKIKQALGL